MDNMKIYEQVRAVPEEAKKTIGAGRLKGFTDVNPMWRIKRLTEVFGPCGIGWWYEVIQRDIQTIGNEVCVFVDIKLYIVDPETGEVSHGIYGTGGSKLATTERSGVYVSDEAFKMAQTDALSVACKNLGIGADVYFEKDRTKYTTPEEEPRDANAPATDKERKRTFALAMKKFGEDKEKVKQFYKENGVDYMQMTADQYVKLVEALK